MTPDQLADEARSILDAAWREPGFCVPNPDTYPFQWLWDSCFHAVIWTALGEVDRAVAEVANALSRRHDDGFVPHVVYWADPDHHADFWGRRETSVITQPPMFGHALAVLADAGAEVPVDLADAARQGLGHLLGPHRRTPSGLVAVLHPWETGCDDSLRWDDWTGATPTVPFDRERWRETKAELVAALRLDDAGTPVGSDRFVVGSVAFTALVAWNIDELARVGLADPGLVETSAGLATALEARWDGETYVDEVVVGPGPGASAQARTLEALLPVLVERRPEVRSLIVDELADPAAFGAPFGPRGAHVDEPTADVDGYWRGTTWPQLLYLLERVGIDTALVEGALSARWAEYWNPETGRGRGARPQTWSALAAVPRPPRGQARAPRP